MALLVVCDRCGSQSPCPARACSLVSDRHLPPGWVYLSDKDLCPACDAAHREFFRPLPRRKEG
jgi:hypothetical protein